MSHILFESYFKLDNSNLFYLILSYFVFITITHVHLFSQTLTHKKTKKNPSNPLCSLD